MTTTPPDSDRTAAVATTDGDIATTHKHRATDAALAEEKDRFGGMHFFLAFFGWLTAVGLTVLLAAVASAIGGAAGAQNTLDTNQAGAAGIFAAIVFGVILLIAYFCGGYVAGRMARFSGLKQGLAVWLWSIVIAIVLGVVGLVANTQTNIVGQLGGSIPTLPFSADTLTVSAIIAAVGVLVVTLIGALLGGLAGMRYHRKVDRVGAEAARA